jgi:hypothetical protein
MGLLGDMTWVSDLGFFSFSVLTCVFFLVSYSSHPLLWMIPPLPFAYLFPAPPKLF